MNIEEAKAALFKALDDKGANDSYRNRKIVDAIADLIQAKPEPFYVINYNGPNPPSAVAIEDAFKLLEEFQKRTLK